MKYHLNVVVLSPHRLVPLALRAAGRASGSYEVIGSAGDSDEAFCVIETVRPDVLVLDPTTVSMGRSVRLLEQAAPYLRNPNAAVLLLEPAQAVTVVAARFLWDAGVRCAMSSQESPDIWPVGILSAARGTTYLSPVAAEMFGHSRTRTTEFVHPAEHLVVPRPLQTRHSVLGAMQV